ncbi:hypothetical protein [Paraburkholderia sp. 32]|uniref:hypothetical protein n=1 Tax=unclassified Paraburkholderia TaxID=2615204 RepID=UPI003D25F0CB
MWKCIRCHVEIPFDDVEPSIDDFAVYFICPHCGQRNRLVNVGKPNGPIVLEQTGD